MTDDEPRVNVDARTILDVSDVIPRWRKLRTSIKAHREEKRPPVEIEP